MTDRWLTAQQVADLLGLNPQTVRRMAAAGDLPAVRLAGPRARAQVSRGRLRFAESAITEWQHRQLPAAG